ncbi:MAG: type VI secretion protein IcmF/TssM N-terminal domain-containing protein [Candidatus Symbiodolus clandestinus]
MRKLLIGLCKIVLVCLVIGLLSAIIFYLIDCLGWPWWAGAALLSALAGGTVLIIMLYRSYRRRQEQAFVQRVIEQDERLIQQTNASSRQRLQELQQRWLDAVATLRQSRLRYQGNPLYILPWYLVLGESQAGKSSAIAQAQLTAILSPVGPIPGVAATRHCDWWFFEQSVVIDTAGRYVKPLHGVEDDREWHQFLTLLTHYRQREPLNGIVIALPAEQLLPPLTESLYDSAQHIGDRLHRVMRQLGARIPVYLMVTKADKIKGFVEYASTLTVEGRQQAFGYTIPNPFSAQESMSSLLTKIVTSLQQRLLQESCESSSRHLLLATELMLLAEPLQRFAAAAFSHENYHEPVLLRGLYFTSANQPGNSLEGVSQEITNQCTPASASQGLFLYDLFAKRLPKDRSLYQPIKELLRWRTLREQLLLLTLLLLSFATITLLSANYLDGEKQLYQLRKTLNHAKAAGSSVEQEILALDVLRQTIIDFENKRQRWHLFRTLLQQPVDQALQQSKYYFVQRFTEHVRQPLEQHFWHRLNQRGAELPAALVGDAAGHLAWLLECLKARSPGEVTTVQRDDRTIMRELIGVDIEYQNELWRLYQAFIGWQPDQQNLHDLASASRQALNWLLSTHRNWAWIIEWASDPSNISAVKADNFWQFPLKDPAVIPGAYTAQGRKMIGRLLSQLQTHSQQADFDKRLQRFWNRYALQYQQSWSQFLQNFPTTASQLKIGERLLIANSLLSPSNPFFSLQRIAEQELSAITDLLPLDLSALQLSNAIIAKQQAIDSTGAQGLLQQGGRLLVDVVTSQRNQSAEYLEKITLGVKFYQQLQQSLQALLPSLQTQATAAKRMADLFTTTSTEDIAFKGWEALSGLQKLLSVNQKQMEGVSIFENLYRFLLETELALAADYLQDQWEAEVYGALQYIAPEEQSRRLFSESGLLTKFMQGSAAPFVTRQADGWHPTRYQGLAVPFNTAFFEFVERGARLLQSIKESYLVVVQARPLEVNRQLKDKPVAASLTLQCVTEPQLLVNYNYPIKRSFRWQPGSCGDVTLEIDFPDLSLNKVWSGQQGFADFLADFRHGSLRLTPKDFPKQQARLRQKGFEWLKVTYRIEGQQPILQQRDNRQLPVPLTIIDLERLRG